MMLIATGRPCLRKEGFALPPCIGPLNERGQLMGKAQVDG